MTKSDHFQADLEELDLVDSGQERTKLEEQIARRLHSFTPIQKRLAAYILRYPNDAAFVSGGEISREVGVSEAAVSRFIRAAGFRNMNELRNSLTHHIHKKTGMTSRMDNLLSTLQKEQRFFYDFIAGEIEYLHKATETISTDDIERSAELLHQSQMIYLTGMRASLPIREMLDYRLSRLGFRTVHLTDSERYILDKAQLIRKEDVVVGITFQRIPKDVRIVFDQAARQGTPTILITDMALVPKSLQADVILSATRGPQNVANTFTVPMAIASAIIWSLASKLGHEGHLRIEELASLRQRYGYEPTRG